MGSKKADNTPLSIAIVGAGFGGLSLAIALKNAGISTTIFEAQSGKAGGIFGDLFLPNGKQSMKELGLSDMWNGLTKRTAGRPNYVPQENLQRAMREVASDCIRYNNRVLRVEQEKTGGYLNCVIGKEKKYRGNRSSIKEIFEGPFDIVVGADGVLSRFRHCVGCSGRVAILGDARWVQDRFDLGMQRIRCGADIAIRDGIELARILSAEGTKSMGRFCAARKRQEILTRRGNILTAALVAILARTSYPFEGQSLVAALFVSALIHLGGKIRIQLPSISSIPVTLHTLSACCAGLIFGPYIGAFGGGLYALLWTIFHVYTRQEVTSSWGYIFGMIPCSIVSGGLYDEENHPMLAAVVGQSCTLLMGALWLIVVTDDDAKKNPFDVIRGGVLPFLPGLVIKSFVAWRILPIHREYTSTE